MRFSKKNQLTDFDLLFIYKNIIKNTSAQHCEVDSKCQNDVICNTCTMQ